MHELSIALSLLETAEEQSRQRGGVRISAIHLRVGPLSGVMADALAGAFEMATERSEFAGCRLVITETPLVINCPTCKAEREVESIQKMCCNVCGTATADVASGRELEVFAMEIDE